ncbi:MAG: dipeptidase [Gaiella sp.]
MADLHLDLLQELMVASDEPNPFRSRWLSKLRTGGVRLQCCPIYVPAEECGEAALRVALRQINAFHRALRENSDAVALVQSRGDVESLGSDERVGLLLTLEGAEPVGYDLDLVDLLWQLGVRMVTVTRARANLYAGGNAEPDGGGLTALGEALVDRLVARDIILDLTHTSERSFAEILGRVEGRVPVVLSHAGCRALHAAGHNVTDAQMRAVAAAGGLIGIIALPHMIDTRDWTLDRVVDHLEHAVDVMGEGAVALGSDFTYQLFGAGALPRLLKDTNMPDGVTLESAIDGLRGPEDFGGLAAAMAARGWSEALRRDVLHGNALRFLASALPDG